MPPSKIYVPCPVYKMPNCYNFHKVEFSQYYYIFVIIVIFFVRFSAITLCGVQITTNSDGLCIKSTVKKTLAISPAFDAEKSGVGFNRLLYVDRVTVEQILRQGFPNNPVEIKRYGDSNLLCIK